MICSKWNIWIVGVCYFVTGQRALRRHDVRSITFRREFRRFLLCFIAFRMSGHPYSVSRCVWYDFSASLVRILLAFILLFLHPISYILMEIGKFSQVWSYFSNEVIVVYHRSQIMLDVICCTHLFQIVEKRQNTLLSCILQSSWRIESLAVFLPRQYEVRFQQGLRFWVSNLGSFSRPDLLEDSILESDIVQCPANYRFAA